VAENIGMNTKTKPTRSARPIDPPATKTAPTAFASILPEIRAVPASAIRRNNLDVSRAARRGLAVSERLVPLLSELLVLPGLDAHAVISLRTRALAVIHADELVQEGRASTMAHLAVLLTEATPMREIMLSSAEALAVAGYVAIERVAAIRRGHGHADTAADLQALGRLYRELWDHVHDKVPVTLEMVERSITLSAELQAALGIREIDEEDPLIEPAGPEYVRAQAFVLFTQAYEECRRGVAYLRWHEDDVVAIVPSLYRRRGRTGARAVEETEMETDELEGGEARDLSEPVSRSTARAVATGIANARIEA
jgi:hypothetical protein